MGDTPRTHLAAYAAAAVLLVVAAVQLLGGRGDRAGGTPTVALDGAGAGVPGGSEAAGAGRDGGRGKLLYVHVAGAVRRPGLYGVPPGARVAVAVRRAGGPTRRADPVGLNLAARVSDGQQVVVPGKGVAAAAGGAAGGAEPGGSQRPIQLSTATAEQLDGLDGIGPALAERILEYREKHGGFKSLDELREVDGIGEKRFAALRKGLQP